MTTRWCGSVDVSIILSSLKSNRPLMGQRGGDPLQGIIEIHMGIQGSETHR